jgi:LacI family repressor for deo operon, udp, cdd, tsx, nupC, and nupG
MIHTTIAPSDKKKPSSHDVAKLAGVSQSTVSRVFSIKSNNPISEKTRLRVIESANQLGYTPNPIAQALRGKQSHLLGLIVREIADPFFARLIAEFSTQARALNYHIVLGHAESDPDEALAMTTVLDTRHTDGVFILGDLHSDEDALLKMLEHNHAIIALCRGPSPATVCTVNTDNHLGTSLLLDHLVSLGHRDFGFIDGGWLGDIRERREAFIDYLREHNLPSRPEWIQPDANSAAGGYSAMLHMLSLKELPTAVYVSDDLMSIGVMKAISNRGLRIPEDISVVGFDNIDFTQYLTPGLTTICQPIDMICQKALQLMLSMIENPGIELKETIFRLPPELIIRSSSGPVPTRS